MNNRWLLVRTAIDIPAATKEDRKPPKVLEKAIIAEVSRVSMVFDSYWFLGIVKARLKHCQAPNHYITCNAILVEVRQW
jgi:hypothetical protein